MTISQQQMNLPECCAAVCPWQQLIQLFAVCMCSITEYGFEAPHGWALQLSAAYSRRADIINRGFGGG